MREKLLKLIKSLAILQEVVILSLSWDSLLITLDFGPKKLECLFYKGFFFFFLNHPKAGLLLEYSRGVTLKYVCAQRSA